MESLVASNLKHHPGRTAASVLGVAVGVILVVLTVGLVRGSLRDRGQRDANIGVEIMLRQGGQGLSLTSADMTIPVTELDAIRAVPGVAVATPVGQNLEMGGGTGLGIRQIDGIEFDDFTRAGNLRIVEGAPLPASGDVAIIDIKEAASKKLKPGDSIKWQSRELKIVGIYEPEAGARIKIPLATMQEALATPGKTSMIFVKCQNAAEQEAVARRIHEKSPDYTLLFTRDLPQLFASGFSAFNVFLNVVKGLATVISVLVILLTMYTTVAERTRQIGILKSLGASKWWIAWVFEKEALMISLLGVAGGLAIAILARYALVYGLGWKIELEADSIFYASLAGIVSGLLGALYPALRAASQDPVDALSYE
ncbi:MAG: FtsX-like permease family protein [Blastocatellia bacterium]|nr:FtsX-like permease family protein [Blastocatellia bacterium]